MPPVPLKCMANLMALTTSTMRFWSMRLTEYMTTKKAKSGHEVGIGYQPALVVLVFLCVLRFFAMV